MKLNRGQIQEQAMRVLEAHPQGIRWMELLRAVEAFTPDTPYKSVRGAVYNLLSTRTTDIVKVARGTYQLTKFVAAEAAAADAQEMATSTTPVKAETPGSEALTEQDFYASFAEWLVENDEVTVASALGGNSLGGRWGTPDVIGVLKPRAQDIFKFEPQIVTAEIKAVPTQPVVAFGQAVAYRLFSHKSYIAVPRSTTSDDMSRLTFALQTSWRGPRHVFTEQGPTGLLGRRAADGRGARYVLRQQQPLARDEHAPGDLVNNARLARRSTLRPKGPTSNSVVVKVGPRGG